MKPEKMIKRIKDGPDVFCNSCAKELGHRDLITVDLDNKWLSLICLCLVCAYKLKNELEEVL